MENRLKVQVFRGETVTMRDGVKLSSDIYRPEEEGRFPGIVIRTPYGKSTAVHHETGMFFAQHGYIVMVMDVRGRGDSDGDFKEYRNEGLDGYDSIEWLAAQNYCTGNIGTLGGSYLGRIQWLTALHQPPSLKTMVPIVTPSDPFVEWPTGVPGPHSICWTYMTSGRVQQNISLVDWERVYETLPLIDMDKVSGRYSERWREEVGHNHLDDWWKELCYQDKFDDIDLPVLHISGWYDDEQIGTPLNFHGMTHTSKDKKSKTQQRLLMGPWSHQVNSSTKVGEIDFGEDALINMNDYQLKWFDFYLKNKTNGQENSAPVEIFVMGDNEWREEYEWPLKRTEWTKYYLNSGGRANSRFGDGTLQTQIPEQSETDQYEYNPADPVPFITELVSHQIGGPDDYSAIERRDDVLVYSTEQLTGDTEVTGPVTAELYASTDAKDTDFMVKLLDVHPGGYVQRLTDGMVRGRFKKGMDKPELLTPGEVYKFEIDCWNTSHVFKKGHKIRVEVSSSAFPKYDRQLNTGATLGVTSEMKTAQQTIYHDADYSSSITLPIIPR